MTDDSTPNQHVSRSSAVLHPTNPFAFNFCAMTEIRTPEPGDQAPLFEESDDPRLALDDKPQDDPVDHEPEDDEAERRTQTNRTTATRNSGRSSSTRRQFTFFAFFVFAVWLAYAVARHRARKQKSKIIYATRYSKDHKYRPAASPVITETLKDGRIRLRGATPPPEIPTPSPTPATRKRRTRKRKNGGRKVGKKGPSGRK